MQLGQTGQLKKASCCQGDLQLAVAPVRKLPPGQDTADEEAQAVVFLVDSGELRLPFGWLQMFAAFMEFLKTNQQTKRGKKKTKERDPQ